MKTIKVHTLRRKCRHLISCLAWTPVKVMFPFSLTTPKKLEHQTPRITTREIWIRKLIDHPYWHNQVDLKLWFAWSISSALHHRNSFTKDKRLGRISYHSLNAHKWNTQDASYASLNIDLYNQEKPPYPKYMRIGLKTI